MISHPPSPKFGCRVFASIHEDATPSKTSQKRLKDLLIEGENNFKSQSPARPVVAHDGIYDDEAVRDLPPRGNKDGWGIYTYKGDQLDITQKSLKAAHEDADFDATAQKVAESNPNVVLAHLRVNTSGKDLTLDEIHPFTQNGWTAMMNGVLSGARTPAAQKPLKDESGNPILGVSPKTQNGTEVALFTFLTKLKQQGFASFDSAKIPLETLQRTFAETIQSLVAISPPTYRELEGKVNGIKGFAEFRPTANMVLTDGHVMLAHRKSRKLYLASTHTDSGKPEYLISSEPIQSKKTFLQALLGIVGVSPKNRLDWAEIPENHILSIAKKKEGVLEPTLMPMSKALAPIEVQKTA